MYHQLSVYRCLQRYELWKRYLFLIVAVGCINDRLVGITGVSRLELRKKVPSVILSIKDRFVSRSQEKPSISGPVASNEAMRSLLTRAALLYPATLARSEMQVALGGVLHPCFKIEASSDPERVEKTVKCPECNFLGTLGLPCIHSFC